MLKIFVQNKPLFLVDKIEPEIEDYLHRPSTIFIDELNAPAVKTMLYELEQPEYYAGILQHNNIDEILKEIKSHLTVMVAAGGLVRTKTNDLLLIFRKGKWDLPKGKLDEGENLESCALREIEEETGATSLQIQKPLTITYHTYYEKEKHILKESHWYSVNTEKKSLLKPQTEEDIEKCVWATPDQIPTYMNNMHASIIDVLNIGLAEINQKVS